MAKPKQQPRPAPEPEITLRECLLEQLRVIRAALPKKRTVRDWYDDGADFDELVGASGGEPPENDIEREEVAIAFGYLRGAHEALDVTMSEMLDNENISMETLGPIS